MTSRQDDIKANLIRNIEMMDAADRIKARFEREKLALQAEDNGTGKTRDADLTKRSKREIKADLDDTLLCMLKFEAEATECRKQGKIFLKEFERRP